jgi:uncharacterized protein (DUF1499 family)
MRRVVRGIGYVLVFVIVARIAAAFVWPTINDVTTGETPEYADLQPQRIDAPPARVFDAALASAQALGWDVAATDRDAGRIEAVATTRVFRFKDDVTITVAPEGSGSVVNIRSHSRVGKGDLGTNARRIRRFQADLGRRVGAGSRP